MYLVCSGKWQKFGKKMNKSLVQLKQYKLKATYKTSLLKFWSIAKLTPSKCIEPHKWNIYIKYIRGDLPA